jgi:transcription termination/antitermination protein NusG
MKKEEPEVETEFKIGDLVEVIQGLFKGLKGKIVEIDRERQRLKVLVPVMNREIPVEVDFLQVKRL